MSKRLSFYSTRADLERALSNAEKNSSIYYVCCRSKSEEKLFKIFKSCSDIDDFSVSKGGSLTLDDSYLIFTSDIQPVIESMTKTDGTQRLLLDQKLNPHSVRFSPGGIFKENVALIAGEISSFGDSEKALELFKVLSKSIKKNSKRVNAYWLGEDAMKHFSSGMRLTPDVAWPEFQNLSVKV